MPKRDRKSRRSMSASRTAPTIKFTTHLVVINQPRMLFSNKARDVLDAFSLAGVKGPYCQFHWREPFTSKHLEAIKRRTAKGESLGEVIGDLERHRRWFIVDENHAKWSTLLLSPNTGAVGLGGGAGQALQYETDVPRVEQWIELARYFENAFKHCQIEATHGSMKTVKGDLSVSKMVVGKLNGEWLQVFDSPGWMPEGVKRYEHWLSTPAQTLLVWAVIHQRLQRMFNDVHDTGTRSRMRAIVSFLERRTPALEWMPSDFELLAHLRCELIAFAPCWRVKSGKPSKQVAVVSVGVGKTQIELIRLTRDPTDKADAISATLFRELRRAAGIREKTRGYVYPPTEIRLLIQAAFDTHKVDADRMARAWTPFAAPE